MLTKPTKICLILGSHWSYRKSGSEYQAKLLIDQLKKNKKYGLFYIYAGSKDGKVDLDGVTVYSLRRRKLLSRLGKPRFLDFLKMIRILKEVQPDVIYQRTASAYTGIAAHFARKHRCKMVWHIASDNDLQTAWFKYLCTAPVNYSNKKFLQYGIKYADYIIGQTKHQNELLKENYGRECDAIIPNAHPVPDGQIRKTDPVRVVWVSNLRTVKQPELFIQLAEKFKDLQDVKFIMVGRRGQNRWQAKLASKMEKLNNLEYLGEKPINHVNRILCESHVLVNTSAYEGFPNTFIQAWMRGVPVVSLNVDPDDILLREGIGFKSGTFENLCRDVMTLIGDKDMRDTMGQRARLYAINNHSIETVDNPLSVVQSIL